MPAVALAVVVVAAGAEVGASFEYSTNANVNGCSGPSFVILTLATIVVAASLAGRWSPFKVASSVLPSRDRRIGKVAMSFGALVAGSIAWSTTLPLNALASIGFV